MAERGTPVRVLVSAMEATAMRRTGRCLCGAVTFEAEVEGTGHGACHCGMCRRWCGGAPLFTVHAADVTFGGGDGVTRYASSEWAERGFCAACGTALFYFFKPMGLYAMAAGAFDDAATFALGEEIFIDEKPDGYALAGDHPRLTGAEVAAKYAVSAAGDGLGPV